jgi:hypothetical protein
LDLASKKIFLNGPKDLLIKAITGSKFFKLTKEKKENGKKLATTSIRLSYSSIKSKIMTKLLY